MEKKNKKQKEELQSRRDFFKKATKMALPVLGAIALANTPLLSHAMDESPMGCKYGCSSGCYRSCNTTCENTCEGTCKHACGDGCEYTCSGTCKNACNTTCKHSSSK